MNSDLFGGEPSPAPVHGPQSLTVIAMPGQEARIVVAASAGANTSWMDASNATTSPSGSSDNSTTSPTGSPNSSKLADSTIAPPPTYSPRPMIVVARPAQEVRVLAAGGAGVVPETSVRPAGFATNPNGLPDSTRSAIRPAGNSSEKNLRKKKKLILECHLSPGDIVMLTAAVRDLHQCYPGRFVTDVRTRCQPLWQNNPYVTPLEADDPEVEVIPCAYPLINLSNLAPCHCVQGFTAFLNDRLGLSIRTTRFHGDIHLAPHEKTWHSQVHELTGENTPFWILVSGGKRDMTVKWWSPRRFQKVVDHFRGRIQFVQVGHSNDHHPALEGVIDLRGRTDLRQLVRLVHHARGVLCPVTALMHLAAAVETRPGRPPHRPCVVIAGGREPPNWEAYPHHQFIHNVGALPCCAHGGCWRARVTPLGDGDERDRPDALCQDVAGDLPRCMDLITAEEVIRRIELYFRGGMAEFLTPSQARAAERGVAATRADVRPAPHAPARGTVLIQHAAGSHMQMLDLTAGWHNDYAVRHRIDFWSVRGHLQSERAPHWDKILLIRRALALGYETVIWVDADALVVKPEESPRGALPATGPPIGMCRHPAPFGEQPWHFNSGVICARNTPLAQEFFERVWNTGPTRHPWQEQIGINRLAQAMPAAVQQLSDRWNCTLDATSADDPVIRAWHGLGMNGLPHLARALQECVERRTVAHS